MQHFYQDIVSQVRALVPAQLITCTFVDVTGLQAKRTFTTMPDVFPLSGCKDISIEKSRWNDTIFKQKKCFSINRVRDYPEHFYDWELIENAGLCSALCVPIINDNTVLGTMNILDCEGAYTHAPLHRLVKIAGQLGSVYTQEMRP